MKLALISDLHGQPKTLSYLEKIISSERPGGLIISGDITSAGENDFSRELVNLFTAFETVFLVCGNSDTDQNKAFLENSIYSIHAKCRTYKKNKFCGLSYPEDIPLGEDLTNSVFVTHRPPIAKLLKIKHLNSPRFHISGHLHQAAYVREHFSTIHIQVPTLQDGRYGLLELESGLVNFKSVS
jgi:predicted phosphodiesterase